jgi:hypothetical protein
MAVFIAGGAGGRWAFNRGVDNGADQLIAFQAQTGPARTYVPDVGAILERQWTSENAQIDVGLNVFGDGQTFLGNNNLTSASAPFAKAMRGLSFLIFGHGQRTIVSVTDANTLIYSGPSMGDHTGLRFTQPLGLALFEDGIVDGQVLTSALAPFAPRHVGQHVSLANLGTRIITAHNSATEVEVDGLPMIRQDGVFFTLPVIMEAADRLLAAGSQVIDAHRTPETNAPMVMRWHLGT